MSSSLSASGHVFLGRGLRFDGLFSEAISPVEPVTETLLVTCGVGAASIMALIERVMAKRKFSGLIMEVVTLIVILMSTPAIFPARITYDLPALGPFCGSPKHASNLSIVKHTLKWKLQTLEP